MAIKSVNTILHELALLIRALDEFFAVFKAADPQVRSDYRDRLLAAEEEVRKRMAKARE